MTQEFKEQNALMVDGRLLCRHFLWGRCIKARRFCGRSDCSCCHGNIGILKAPVCSWLQGDDCQLEHLQGYNDLIKELCKFYVQGFCSKGGDCPYMHHILSVPVAVVSSDASVMSCFLHSVLQSFPCKYFHGKGHCSQGGACRFSHEPLDDVTTNLLDEVGGAALLHHGGLIK